MQSERHVIYQAVLEAEKPLVPTQKPVQCHFWIKSDLDSKRKNFFVPGMVFTVKSASHAYVTNHKSLMIFPASFAVQQKGGLGQSS